MTRQVRLDERAGSPRRLLATLGFALCVGALMFFLADRDGYEGDDMNVIAAMLHLDAGLDGRIEIYRYPWQPLGYWIGAAIYNISRSPTAIFLLAPLAGTLSLTALVVFMSKATGRRHGILFYASILILVPELWFSGLYFNTSVLAMPLIVVALLLLRERPAYGRVILAGILAGLAALIRLDFLLACPMLAVVAYERHRSPKWTLLLTLGVCAALAAALAARLVSIGQILADYRLANVEMIERGQSPGWNAYTKAWVVLTALHPAGWLLLAVGGPLETLRSWKENVLVTLAYGIAALFLLFPASSLLSAKYLLPLMVYLPAFLVRCFERLEERLPPRCHRFSDITVVVIAVVALSLSIEPHSRPPFLRFSVVHARQVATHDGARSFGAYLVQMFNVNRSGADNDFKDRQKAAAELLAFMRRPLGPDILVAGYDGYFNNGSIGWRQFQLLAEKNKTHGSVVGDHLLLFEFGGRRLWVGAYPERALAQIADDYRSIPRTIDLRDDQMSSREAYLMVHDAIRSFGP